MKIQIPNWPLWLKIATLLAAFAVVLRFVGLEVSPSGFYIDEAAISSQILCLQQSGHDHFGKPWPLFSQVLGGGYATPAQLYLGAAWTKIFGESISSFRSLAALFGSLTVLGVFLLAQTLWKNPAASVLSALTVALSPWGFLHSRIAWDPSLAPAFLVWSLYFLLRFSDRNKWPGFFAGFLAALACYTYPPLRLQAILFLPWVFLFAYFQMQVRPSRLIAFSITFLTIAAPLIWLTLTGEIQGRFSVLSIWNPDFLKTQGDSSPLTVLRVFFENLALHLSPRYLFTHGDSNLRHSTQAFGQWGWLEMTALLFVPWLLFRRALLKNRKEVFIYLILVMGYLSAVIPAAITWESNPHSLRSISAYPFIGLLTGFTLMRAVEKNRHQSLTVLLVASLFGGFYFWDFFFKYPARSAAWFDKAIVQIADQTLRKPEPDTESFLAQTRAVAPDYQELALRYYLMRAETLSCHD